MWQLRFRYLSIIRTLRYDRIGIEGSALALLSVSRTLVGTFVQIVFIRRYEKNRFVSNAGMGKREESVQESYDFGRKSLILCAKYRNTRYNLIDLFTIFHLSPNLVLVKYFI